MVALAGGCASDAQKRDAINDVNRAFRADYEGILAEKGTRIYKVTPRAAFAALGNAMQRLGMRVGDAAPELGYLNVFAPAPAPLTPEEWRRAADADLPRLRQITEPHVGLLSRFISFEPEGLEIVINATALQVGAGTEISLTTRMREITPPRSGIPRREYPPPSGVRAALDKIWAELDGELRAARTGR
jgi:hypothetical protein